jgi:DOPA 4,5-dioxygenase
MHLTERQGSSAKGSTDNSNMSTAMSDFKNGEIREFHFHVYFFFNAPQDVEAAVAIRDKLVAAVAAGEFVAVCDGVTSKMLPGLKEATIPPINMHPIGPHPCGSFEVWVPDVSFAAVHSWFMLHRGDTSVLVHPLTERMLLDHTHRAMWLGPSFRLNLAAFTEDNKDDPQYPELGLGYNTPSL